MAKFSQFGIQAERLFVEDGKSPEMVSADLRKIFGAGAPSPNTIDNWRQKYNWDAKRKAFRTAPQGAIQSLESALPTMAYKLEELIQRAEPNSQFIQEAARIIAGIAKLTKAIQSTRKETNLLASVVLVMGRFADYVCEHEKNEEIKEHIVNHIQGFGNVACELVSHGK